MRTHLAQGLRWAPWLLLGALGVYLLVQGSDFILHLGIVTAIYAVLAMSLNLAFGYTGLFSIAHASLFGIGAYGAGLAMSQAGVPLAPAILCGGLAAAMVGAAVSAIFSRLEGPYFAIGTFALGELVRIVLNEWRGLTGGPAGLMVPRPTGAQWMTFGLDLANRRSFFALALLLMGLTAAALALLLRSRLGARMMHVRDDPYLAASLGVGVLRTKIVAFFISGLIAGLAGAVFGVYLQFIAPSSFSGMESVRLVMMLVIGGAGTLFGPVVGAAIIVLLPQALRINPTDSLILTGVILVVVVLFLPKGIVGALSQRADAGSARRRAERSAPCERATGPSPIAPSSAKRVGAD
ncbi:leucine/isoleucine/valine transporter permease subunit [Variovorax sp. SRS16]|uniref:branched-chain amino acid ABC transporter permease n=1 Tax=Variovorax sp. SRS16 TaxID=282217 RepID=UPI001319ACA6|nr:branched-chain amino acid ABC transporter permease [Variovorax sp. SRS16]VTU15331.1 leucine/isoleucine/valine transporter permease subunit [Variovorax sp. SRS16]